MPKSRGSSGRKWTPAQRAKFRLSMAARRINMRQAGKGHHRVVNLRMAELVLVRRLKKEAVARVRDSGELNDLELTALTLANMVLPPRSVQ